MFCVAPIKAIRAGAEMANLEYMQFHPTTLYLPGERRFLLTEALRGDGAILLDPVHRYRTTRKIRIFLIRIFLILLGRRKIIQ